jgi:hypothetical protein
MALVNGGYKLGIAQVMALGSNSQFEFSSKNQQNTPLANNKNNGELLCHIHLKKMSPSDFLRKVS